MSASASFALPTPLLPERPRHCPPEEYAAFVGELRQFTPEWREKLLRFHGRFVDAYPDLDVWAALPPRTRLGWQNLTTLSRRKGPAAGFDAQAGWINHNARQYLIYLSLTGRLHLDWGWLLGIGVLKPWTIAEALGLPLGARCDELLEQSRQLGLPANDCRQRVHWVIARLVLHRADPDIDTVTLADLERVRDVVRHVPTIPGISDVLDQDTLRTAPKLWGTYVFQTSVVLFHAGIVDALPRRNASPPRQPVSRIAGVRATMERYLDDRRLVDRPRSIDQAAASMRRLSAWIDEARPQLRTLTELRRDDLVEFVGWLHDQRKTRHPDQPLSMSYRRAIIWQVMAFFRHGANNEWDEMPDRAPLSTADIPRGVDRVPRYIPEHQLEPLMAAVRRIDCPYQRCALLVARWSGARRGEIRKLHIDCLDSYPDGTARLRLAAGKSKKERTVPVHDEAAAAIRELLAIRAGHVDRPVHDPDLGRPIRYLFVNKGRLASTTYLFEASLATACAESGLLDGDGKPLVTAHRFRHTLGTQLAERGARTQTIMKVLGHESANMSMVYAHISDPTILADYAAVLGPGAVIAGPLATALRGHELGQAAIDWLKTNFYKTELELGRCLRLPTEGPCECDLYLSCSKFVTTPQYAPRLRDRLVTERQLTADARDRGWAREVERHERVAERIRCLLRELGEPEDEPA